MRKSTKELLDLVEPEGWVFDRFTGGTHIRLRHTSGAVHVVASTPSGMRAGPMLAALRRAVREQGERVRR